MNKIKVWVHKNFQEINLSKAEIFRTKTRDMQDYVEAELFISPPDIQVKISKSSFERAWKEAKFGNGPDEFRDNIMGIIFNEAR